MLLFLYKAYNLYSLAQTFCQTKSQVGLIKQDIEAEHTENATDATQHQFVTKWDLTLNFVQRTGKTFDSACINIKTVVISNGSVCSIHKSHNNSTTTLISWLGCYHKHPAKLFGNFVLSFFFVDINVEPFLQTRSPIQYHHNIYDDTIVFQLTWISLIGQRWLSFWLSSLRRLLEMFRLKLRSTPTIDSSIIKN